MGCRFGSMAPDGQYHSPIKNKSARFNAMLAVLTPSRLAVTFQAMGPMKDPIHLHPRCAVDDDCQLPEGFTSHQTSLLKELTLLAKPYLLLL
ncbi:Acyl-Coenzyme A Oxidase-Like Protein [Manis pentadactyla]|nr:Acyl-Coenzyme A Oxidase-Like Protein [Manis pentadactyla]